MKNRLAITGLGMITSVGHDVETACASIRCGINRASSLETLTLDEEDTEEVPMTGHQLSGITDGYKGVALYAIIAKKHWII